MYLSSLKKIPLPFQNFFYEIPKIYLSPEIIFLTSASILNSTFFFFFPFFLTTHLLLLVVTSGLTVLEEP